MANAMSTARSFVLADGLEGLDDGLQGVMAISRGGLWIVDDRVLTAKFI